MSRGSAKRALSSTGRCCNAQEEREEPNRQAYSAQSRYRSRWAPSVAKSDPDGHTILSHSAAHTIAPAIQPNLSYDPARDFAAVAPLSAQGRNGNQGVPPGQMPPAGMCRIWIDGVPPGRQPRPTDCATARARVPVEGERRARRGDTFETPPAVCCGGELVAPEFVLMPLQPLESFPRQG